MSDPSQDAIVRIANNASSRELLFRTLLATVAGSVLILILLFALVLGPARSPSKASPLPFCCPAEARHLAFVVNGTYKPCDNLYAYVCTSVFASGNDKSNMLLRSLRSMISDRSSSATVNTSLPSTSSPRSKALEFLRDLYAACMVSLTSEAHRDEYGLDVPAPYFEMAAALWDNGKELFYRLNEATLLLYLLRTNFVYQISSAVEIDYTTSDRTFVIEHVALYWNSEMHLVCKECVSAALSAYKREPASKVLVTTKDVAAFAKQLHKLYPKRRFIDRFTMANISELWPAEHFADALRSLSWMNPSDGFRVETFATQQLVVLRKQITMPKNWAVGAVYLVAHAVARGLVEVPFNISDNTEYPYCERFTTRLQHLVDTAYWELYGDSEKEKLISEIFKSVRDSVALEVTSKLLVSAEAKQAHLRFRTLLANVTLLTAAVRNAYLAEIPAADTLNFVGTLLLGRSFEFHARKGRDALGIFGIISEVKPVLRYGRQTYLEVPASFYSFVRVGKNPSPHNMAVLGARLAELLWRLVLLDDWEDDPPGSVEKLLRCFADACRSKRGEDLPQEYEVSVRLAAASLALRTVARVMSSNPDWYIVRRVNGPHSVAMSPAQFFFLQEAYNRCPLKGYRPDEDYVNIPADFVSEFEIAFQCPSKDSVGRLRACAA
ncbi:hypothetical protein HPB50_005390 [Hyalomma asiaticum]|uniref:Uncharacterized protein n=1 Tax=Hyalomma asiaticum TaxID=266040 RepID=A0ACB7SNM3_HYAAI|nr:hypothetical protein HPB50_005390 [Hyalomma asiaticum]